MTVDTKKLISIVTPFYNEEETVEAFLNSIKHVVETIHNMEFEIVCVNDGSCDQTLEKLLAATRYNIKIIILDLSRNFGKEAALTAGIEEAQGDAVIPIDADLQDPPELIPVLIEYWQNGYEVVLAKRSDRSTDSFLKRKTAELFYRLHNKMAESPIPENVGDFRLMDRCVVEAFKRLPEKRRFMKGLFAWLGFKTAMVQYVRQPRMTGKTKFSGWKLWNFALEGITSFSTAPLRIWTYVGFMVSAFSFAYSLFIIARTLIGGVDVPGYASLLTAMLFLGGVQLIGIGILGEYIGRIYIEAKNRPTYIVRQRYKQDITRVYLD
jgi:polyisoprenyl-phosphate glycosyltransferase